MLPPLSPSLSAPHAAAETLTLALATLVKIATHADAHF